MKFDVTQTWLDNVAYSHSKSLCTERNYRASLNGFCEFVGCTPQQILDEYEATDDRQFQRKYAQYLKAYISQLIKNKYAIGTVGVMIAPIKSFFKYNDLPLGYVPLAKRKITFHNKDITKEDIIEIIKAANQSRERAFYCMMAQSGQRPYTLCNLKLKHIEPDFSKGIIPCKIEVPTEIAKGEFGSYFTFMGEESVQHLKTYFRPNMGPEDYLFTSQGSDKRLNTKSVSGLFARTIEELKAKGIMVFDQKEEGKPREVRLYNLRKFFRNHAGQAGIEYVNFWMGHRANYQASNIPASDVHYFSRENVEFQRQLYAEKAMPHLRLETATPTETDKIIQQQAEEIEVLSKEVARLRVDQKDLDVVRENLPLLMELIAKEKKRLSSGSELG